MDLELAGRVVVVTGASAGIGRAGVELLAVKLRTSSARRATRANSRVAVAFAVPMAMAAAPIHRLSVEQVDGLVAAGLLEDRRMELVEGILFDVVPPNPPHSRTVSTLTRHLARVLPDDLELLVQDALFVHDGFLSPDLFVAPLSDPPVRHRMALLAIEVTHTTHRRDRQKADEYGRASVPEYWLVDLVDREIVVHCEPVDGVYTKVTRHSDGVLDVPGGGTPLDVGALLTAAG